MDPILIAAWVFVAVLVVLVLAILFQKRTPGVEKLEPTLRTEASARGWTVSTTRDGRSQFIRWQGVTDGIQWMVETLEVPSRRDVRRATRWESRGLQGTNSSILLLGLPEGVVMPKLGEAAGGGRLSDFLARTMLQALDSGIDVFFGREIGAAVDATRFQRAERAEAALTGFAVMAENPVDAERWLSGHVSEAVRSAIDAGQPAADTARRPWVLIWREGVSLARMGFARSAAEIEPLVQSGVTIAKAVRW